MKIIVKKFRWSYGNEHKFEKLRSKNEIVIKQGLDYKVRK